MTISCTHRGGGDRQEARLHVESSGVIAWDGLLRCLLHLPRVVGVDESAQLLVEGSGLGGLLHGKCPVADGEVKVVPDELNEGRFLRGQQWKC